MHPNCSFQPLIAHPLGMLLVAVLYSDLIWQRGPPLSAAKFGVFWLPVKLKLQIRKLAASRAILYERKVTFNHMLPRQKPATYVCSSFTGSYSQEICIKDIHPPSDRYLRDALD